MRGVKPSGRTALAVCIAMVILSSIAIALRFIAKAKIKKGVAVEDWCIITAFVLFCAYEGVFLGGLLTSGGSLTEITLPEYGNFLKYAYVIEILFTCTITAIKMSILFFYCTIFTTKAFRRGSFAVGMLCVIWAVVCLLISVFQCRPIDAAWDLSLAAESHCTSYGRYILGYELSNMFLDIAILCLPMVVIRSLQLPTRRKIMVGSIFLLGGLICIICIIRVIYLANLNIHNPDDLERGMNWSNIELAVAIVCACLPTYGPFLKQSPTVPSYLKSWSTQFLSRIAPRSQDGRTSKVRSKSNGSRYDHLDDPGEARMHLTQIGDRVAKESLDGKGRTPPSDADHTWTQLEVV